jgi:signal peptide peptidase SppA
MIHYNLLQEVARNLWAMHEPYLDVMCADLIAGREIGSKSKAEFERVGNVAVVPVHGMILPRASRMFETFFGVRSVENIKEDIVAAIKDDEIDELVLDVDSPGGVMTGLKELGDFIMASREHIRSTSVTNHLNASAAYYLSSQANRVLSTPSGETGSIGVYSRHVDISEMLKNDGIKVTLISAGKHKVEGNMFEPLSDEALERIQAMVDTANADFVAKVARGRDVSIETVNERFGQGRVFTADEALEVGMIDAIQTPEQVVGSLIQRVPSPTRLMAARTALESIRFGEHHE